MSNRNTSSLQKQIFKWLGSKDVDLKDVGGDKRLKFDKNKLLGTGSNGTRVYLGTFRQPVTDEQELVAIKQVLFNTDAEYKKIIHEVKNLQQLNHPPLQQLNQRQNLEMMLLPKRQHWKDQPLPPHQVL